MGGLGYFPQASSSSHALYAFYSSSSIQWTKRKRDNPYITTSDKIESTTKPPCCEEQTRQKKATFRFTIWGQSAKSLTIPHFQPNFQIHGPVQIWKSKNSKCYYLLNYSVFVSALHMNMICVDGSKVLASKEDCLIIENANSEELRIL